MFLYYILPIAILGLLAVLAWVIAGRKWPLLRAQPGASLRYDVEITAEEIANGMTKKIVFNRDEICPACKDSPRVTCGLCRATGRVPTQVTIEVHLSPAIVDGSRIRLTGIGEQSVLNGPRGDLYVFVRVTAP